MSSAILANSAPTSEKVTQPQSPALLINRMQDRQSIYSFRVEVAKKTLLLLIKPTLSRSEEVWDAQKTELLLTEHVGALQQLLEKDMGDILEIEFPGRATFPQVGRRRTIHYLLRKQMENMKPIQKRHEAPMSDYVRDSSLYAYTADERDEMRKARCRHSLEECKKGLREALATFLPNQISPMK